MRIPSRSFTSAVLAVAGAVLIIAAQCGCTPARGADRKDGDITIPASSQGDSATAPTQPILFLHSVHAGDNKIPCLYCHSYADRSPVANIPAVSVCMNCHKMVRGTTPLYTTEINKLVAYADKGQAIPWVRVHQLPDHAFFIHKRHVKAGMQCQSCHGPVEKMRQVYQYSSLKMGWCVTCHKANLSNPKFAASIDCYTCHR